MFVYRIFSFRCLLKGIFRGIRLSFSSVESADLYLDGQNSFNLAHQSIELIA